MRQENTAMVTHSNQVQDKNIGENKQYSRQERPKALDRREKQRRSDNERVMS